MAGALSHVDKELRPGHRVAISGSGGGLGHIGVQIAVRVKSLRVFAIDTGDDKKSLSLEAGAEAFVDFQTEDAAAQVLQLTGEGAHATIVVPGTKAAFQTAPQLVRNLGHIVCVALPPNEMDLPISATLCAASGLSIKGSSVGTEDQMTELLQLALDNVITPSIEVFQFSETLALIERLARDAILERAIVKIPDVDAHCR